ncbi:integrase core domain-containing protein [Hymenobacter caeli]|uniref:integrase core domain-containing protein n=1 Tax=Hymenobacter caeli TaxID=2735894 RepID=UPI00156F8DA6
MSRRGNGYDNAPAESFWSRLKTELLDGSSFRDLPEARLETRHYPAYCNAERRHSALGYQSSKSLQNPFSNHVPTLCGLTRPPQ